MGGDIILAASSAIARRVENTERKTGLSAINDYANGARKIQKRRGTMIEREDINRSMGYRLMDYVNSTNKQTTSVKYVDHRRAYSLTIATKQAKFAESYVHHATHSSEDWNPTLHSYENWRYILKHAVAKANS